MKTKREKEHEIKFKNDWLVYLNAETRRESNKLFEDLMVTVEATQDIVFNFIKLYDPDFKADLRQEIYIKLLTKVNKELLTRPNFNLIGYVYRATLNEAKNQFSKNNNYKKYVNRLDDWAKETGFEWGNNFTYNEDELPQSEFILKNVNKNNGKYESE